MTCLLRHWRMRCALPEPDGKEFRTPAPVIYKKSLEESYMKNSARKILALVLTLVLICTLATAAFAATTAAVDESFYRLDAYAEASIAQRSTTITVAADGLVSFVNIDGSVSCACSYENASGSISTDSFSRTINESDGYFTYTKGYTTATCSKMREATYYVAVEFETDYGYYEFAPNSLVVSYS